MRRRSWSGNCHTGPHFKRAPIWSRAGLVDHNEVGDYAARQTGMRELVQQPEIVLVLAGPPQFTSKPRSEQ
jgi:hypothetical protein